MTNPSMEDWLRKKIQAVTEAAKEAIQETVKDGKEAMELTIATSGTAKSGRQGRIDTGQMLESVGSEVVSETEYTMKARFGYIDGPPPWTLYQDAGFVHWVSGELIEGTNALADAAFTAAIDLEGKLREKMNGI